MSENSKEDLVDVSGSLLTVTAEIHALETKRRRLPLADPALDSIANEIEEKARVVVRLARAQENIVSHLPAGDPESINDIAADRT